MFSLYCHSISAYCLLLLAQLSKKEHDMQVAKEEAQQARRQQYQQDQIQDRLRHYEAQAQLVETLQNELTAAQVGVKIYIYIFITDDFACFEYL